MKQKISILASLSLFGCQTNANNTKNETDVRALTVEVSALQSKVERLQAQANENRLSVLTWEDDVSALWTVVSENESRIDTIEESEPITESGGADAIEAGTGPLGELATRIEELENTLSDGVAATTVALAEKIQITPDGDVVFRDTNVYIQNGTGNTEDLNGKGNLIVGYGASDGDIERSGSHNIVIGDRHAYTSHSGLVSGEAQELRAEYGAVIGGIGNRADGAYATIIGGQYGVASGQHAAIIGGGYNSAEGTNSVVIGGYHNLTTGLFSSAAGGRDNAVNGEYSMVAGGAMNTVEGDVSTIAGGHFLDVDEAFTVAMVDELDAVVGELTSAMSSIEHTLTTANDVQDATIFTLEATDMVLASAIGTAQSTADSNADAIAPLSTQVSEAHSSLAEVNETLTTHETHLDNLEERVSVADELLTYVSLDERDDVLITGANLIIQNGEAETDTINGKGNLIVGLNAYDGEDRTGSHNIVIGDHNAFSGSAGFIVGDHQTLFGHGSAIVAGSDNSLHGDQSAIIGGYMNEVAANIAVAIGGAHNTATATYATTLGGYANMAAGEFSAAGPGRENQATGAYAAALGGALNVVSGESASATGGYAQESDTPFSMGAVTVLSETVESEQARLDDTVNTVESLQFGQGDLARDATVTGARLDTQELTIASVEETTATQTALISGAEADRASIEVELNTVRSDLETADSLLSAHVTDLDGMTAGLSSTLTETNSAVATLQDQMTAADATTDEQNERLDTTDTAIAALEDTVYSYTGDMDTIGGRLDSIETDVGVLNTHREQANEFLDFVTVDEDGDVFLSGTNLHIQNGDAETGTANGKGNLVIGYNNTAGIPEDRSGSHNVVLGDYHHYSSTGGLVSGESNQITHTNAVILGGTDSIASGMNSVIVAGSNNAASQTGAAILGGQYLTVSGGWAAALGGMHSVVSGDRAVAVGGHTNTASASQAAVIGGYNNTASQVHSTTLGGQDNTTATAYGVEPIDTLTSTVEAIEVATSDLTDGLSSTVAENTSRIDDIESDVDTVASSVSAMTSTIENHEDEIVVINYTVTNNQGDIADLEDEDSAIWISIDDLNDSRVLSDGLMNYVTVTPTGNIVFEDTNLIVRNGTGSTDGTVDGKGNIVIGYNEIDEDSFRTGSHNLVLGMANSYSGFGGIIAGYNNVQTGEFSSILGGEENTVSGTHAVVIAGESNRASANNSVIIAGSTNEVDAQGSVIVTGLNNDISSVFSAVVGGNTNDATGAYSAILGGASNTASGESSVVAGGQTGEAAGRSSAILAGLGNTAGSSTSAVVGGNNNVADAPNSSILGGYDNITTANNSSVGGGYWNEADTIGAWVAGAYTVSTELYDVAY
jgi:outer membrane murein-binding lipoprotein Lpp